MPRGLDRTRGQASVKLLAVHGLDLQGVELIELPASYHRLEVEPYHLFVPPPRAIPDRTLERSKPPVEVVAHGQVLAVARDARVPVGQQLAKLGPYFRFRLAGYVPAFPVGVLVLAHAASVFPPVDAALPLSRLFLVIFPPIDCRIDCQASR